MDFLPVGFGVMTGHRTLRWFCLCSGSSAMLPQRPSFEQTSSESPSEEAEYISSASVKPAWIPKSKRRWSWKDWTRCSRTWCWRQNLVSWRRAKDPRLCLFFYLFVCAFRSFVWTSWTPGRLWTTINFKTGGLESGLHQAFKKHLVLSYL